MKIGYTVSDCMSENPLTATPETTIKECAKLLKKNKLGSIIILQNDKPIGIVTSQDIVFRAVANELDLNEPITKIMSKSLIFVSPEQDLFEALELMNKNLIRHLTVAKDGKLVGYLTLKDIIKIEPALFDIYADRIDAWQSGVSIADSSGFCQVCNSYTEELVSYANKKVCPECLNTLKNKKN